MKKKQAVFGIMFMLPGLIGFFAFVLIPLLYALYYSAFDYGGRFAVVKNFQSLFASHAFLAALRNTGLYLLIGGGSIIVISLLLAVVLFRLTKTHFRIASFARVSFLIPIVIPAGVSVLFAEILFASRGSINAWLGTETDWLHTSPYTFWILVFIYIWKNFGYFVIIFFIAIAGINPEIFDAAKCDGAGSVRTLVNIILPQIVPSLFFVFIMSIIGVFKMNRESFLLFGNYPNESAYMFQNFIKNNLDNFEFSRAAGASTVFLLIFSVLVFIMIQLSERSG